MDYQNVLQIVMGALGASLLLISVLQRSRSRREQTRSKKAAADAAAAKRFEEVFGIPHNGPRADVVARIMTVTTELRLNLTRDLLNYDKHNRARREALDLACQMGYEKIPACQLEPEERERLLGSVQEMEGAV
ncbi:MAG: hypothetical protein AAB367_02340 [Patescibacteria group bacterium]